MKSPVRRPALPAQTTALFAYWQAETIRLQEAHARLLDDAQANRTARAQAHTLADRILWRAHVLAAASGLQRHLHQWWHSARWAALLLIGSAWLAGTGAAATVLAQPDGRVNLALALTGLLGLHTVTYALWLLSRLPGLGSGRGLAPLWLWLTRKLARSPDSLLAGQALVSMLGRARATQAALGLLSHAMWSAAFLGMLPTLILLLSTREMRFHWETTLLSPQAFVHLTQALGQVPHWLGFPLPDAAGIAASLGDPAASAAVQAEWSWWLIGCTLVWGLLPRLLALAACTLELFHRLAGLTVDPSLAGWVALRDVLTPTQERRGIDRPGRPAAQGPAAAPVAPALAGTAAAIAHELGRDLPWPPPDLPASVTDLGRSDSRTERQRLRHALASPPAHLLVVCDARLTPDRGTLHWLDELRTLCPDLQVLCLGDQAQRLSTWQALLRDRDIPLAASLAAWQQSMGAAAHPTTDGERHG